jgi:hypothetical protein
VHYPPITKDVVNLLSEVFATAILRSDDETGDFVQAAFDLAGEFGLENEVADQMKELVRRAEGRLNS